MLKSFYPLQLNTYTYSWKVGKVSEKVVPFQTKPIFIDQIKKDVETGVGILK